MSKRLTSDQIEACSKQIFESILPVDLCKKTELDGKFEKYDYIIHIFDGGVPKYDFRLQIKGVNIDKVKKKQIDIKKYLKPWRESTLPVIFVLVNIKSKQMWWEHIDEYYARSRLKLKNRKHGTVTITPTHELTNKNAREFILQCQDIYIKHAKNYSDPPTSVEKYVNEQLAIDEQIRDKVIVVDEYEVEKHKIEDAKHRMTDLFTQLGDKCGRYMGFICLLENVPFDLGSNGSTTREKIREYLKITSTEENLCIEYLLKHKIIERTGEIISIKERKDAEIHLHNLINEKKFKIENWL